MKPVIALTMGDYNGIGPEVLLKTVRRVDRTKSLPLAVGKTDVFCQTNHLVRSTLEIRQITDLNQIDSDRVDHEENLLYVFDPEANNQDGENQPNIQHGQISSLAGKAAMKAVETAISLCRSGEAAAMVTAPISKEAIHRAGYDYPGHTEFLAEKTGTRDFQMILVNDSLRVALATIHVPLKEVPNLISQELLVQQVNTLSRSLQHDFGLEVPRIALLGLNPHAGDGGVLGEEEQREILPVVNTLKAEGVAIEGPFAADGFFGNRSHENYDAILAMYHDQGLIPFKTLSFGAGVNFTAGLPLIRTSPDHGTGFDIAGRNKASESSFLSAYELALEMTLNQTQTRR